MKFIILLVNILLVGCTSQWLALTEKTKNSLQHYKNKTASEFIYKRYITKYDTLGVGYLHQGMDIVGARLDKIRTPPREETFYSLSRKLNLYRAHYNMLDYSQLIKPSRELAKLCIVHGGQYRIVESFKINIPRMNLDNHFSNRFLELAAQYSNATKTSRLINSRKERIYLTDSWGIPLLADSQDIRDSVLAEWGKLEEYKGLRNSSKIDKMLKGDMAIQGEDAFDSAIQEGAFGVFNCKNGSESLWNVSIMPLWNEVKMTNVAVLQIAASD